MKGKVDPDKVTELLHKPEDEDNPLSDAGIDSDDEKKLHERRKCGELALTYKQSERANGRTSSSPGNCRAISAQARKADDRGPGKGFDH